VVFDKHNYVANIWKNVATSGMIFLHTNKFTQMALPELLEKVGIVYPRADQGGKKNP
jgi:hypothetical protein